MRERRHEPRERTKVEFAWCITLFGQGSLIVDAVRVKEEEARRKNG